MKVAIVQEQVDVWRGGAETSTLEMARHLAALGIHVTVVCAEALRHEGQGRSNGATGQRSDEGVELHSVEVDGGSRVGRAVRFVSEADRFCREQGFDVVHAVTPCFSCNLYQPRGGTYVETVQRSISRAAGPLGKLVKRIGRRFNWRQRFLLLAERQVLSGRNPPFVAAVSEYVARQVTSGFPNYPPERLRVVFNGVDIEQLSSEELQTCRAAVRREIGIDEQAPLVLFVAHNFKLKGLRELVRAIAVLSRSRPSVPLKRVKHPQSEPGARATGKDSDGATKRRSDDDVPSPHYVLAVVGRDNPGPYRRLARLLRVSDRVRFLGARDNIRSLYAAADVLAHPTWYDPCSRVVLEALVCGLPVVTTRFNGAAEVMHEGQHGVVIDSPRDAAALAAAIATCLKPELRAACKAEAPKMCEQLSMERHARGLKALYEEVIQA